MKISSSVFSLIIEDLWDRHYSGITKSGEYFTGLCRFWRNYAELIDEYK